MKKTKIICGFPGIGKTSAGQKVGNKRVIDLDIHTFPKNQYPQNYVQAVKKIYESGEYDYILCACHESFRKALKESYLSYIIVRPSDEDYTKDEYMKRLLKAGKSLEYIEYVYSHWDEFISSYENDDSVQIRISNDEYLSNIL